ncbi:MAG: DUF2071 domain-containing protein [Saprospiraceae bacterium]
MSDIDQILSNISHRPFPKPSQTWSYYQEWNDVLFLHWKVPFDILRKLVPEGLVLDVFDGDVYVSLVAFTMQKIRPKNVPNIKCISDFDEINIRTYVQKNSKQGVYFLNIEAGKLLSVYIAKILSGLPYEKTSMVRTKNFFTSKNKLKDYFFEIDYCKGEQVIPKTELDRWLTERYCLFLEKNKNLFCYDIHHKEWEIKPLEVKSLKLDYHLKGIQLSPYQPYLAFYSEGVKVVAWGRKRLI